ncbi:MAG: hypothetical protein WC371_00890 [Parachlamydiales bacterium]|jgi:2'-5' RNA ligase
MRLFLGFRLFSAFLKNEPEGRLIEKKQRHLTLLFLGEVEKAQIEPLFFQLPLPDLAIAPTGYFDKLLFLPFFHPRVVAGRLVFFNPSQFSRELEQYRRKVQAFFSGHGLVPEGKRKFLAHTAFARYPFQKKAWKKAFEPFPVILTSFHLFQSLGGLYQPLVSKVFLPPFEELKNQTAPAFLIRGHNFEELKRNAEMALAFQHPPLLAYLNHKKVSSLEEVILALNDLIYRLELKDGSPFKAIAFHTKLSEKKYPPPTAEGRSFWEWEMLVDI